MKTKLFIISLLTIFLSGCTKNVTPVDANVDNQTNRLLATSFESDGDASIDNWTSPGPPIVKFSRDVPQGGGSYSIFLKARTLGAYVSKNVEALSGNNKYRLTFWSKSTEDPGSIAIYKNSNSQKTLIKTKNITVNKWTKFTIEFQFNKLANEKIQIILGGSDFANPQGYTFFDMIDLQSID